MVSTSSPLGASSLTRWWADKPWERYWMEVSDRGSDLGVDLNAPLFGEDGEPFWSYDLVDEMNEGDVVLHYDRSAKSVVAWSFSVGRSWEDTVVWGARGTSAREKNIQPHERPGRRHALKGPFALEQSLTLSRLRGNQEALETVRGDRKYFPLELGSRPTRPMQGYLFKLPAAFLTLFPELDDVPRFDESPTPGLHPELRGSTATAIGASRPRPEFRPRNEDVRSRRAEPWARDPSEVDRGLSSHARIERLVAEAASQLGWHARAYGQDDPVFDLLLERQDGKPPAIVVEAKSTTPGNEEKQLRLAVGQVLRYRQLLSQSGAEVVAMIALEQAPADSRWLGLCHELAIVMTWPEIVAERLTQLTQSRIPTWDTTLE